MKIAAIGTYWGSFSRNRALLNGLTQANASVVEFNYSVEKTAMEKPGDLSIGTGFTMVWKKIKANLWILKQLPKLRKFDVFLVLYPGLLDLPAVYIISKILGKKIVFDSSISLYDVTVIDKNIVKEDSILAFLIKTMESLLIKLSDWVIVDTPEIKQFVHKYLGVPSRKVGIIPIGANETLYQPSKTKKKISSKNKNIEVFFFGLYNPLQGSEIIIRSAKYFKKQTNIHLTMLGEGPLKASAVEYAKKHNLDNVTFEGFVPEDQLVKRIQASDIMLGIFADSSIARRVIPNKVYAGLACQIAVITANHKAIASQIEVGKEIYTCTPADPKALAKAIINLANNPEKRESIAKAGYLAFQNKFAQQKLGTTLVTQLEKII